jgi:hypothetical protein
MSLLYDLSLFCSIIKRAFYLDCAILEFDLRYKHVTRKLSGRYMLTFLLRTLGLSCFKVQLPLSFLELEIEIQCAFLILERAGALRMKARMG